MSLIHILEKNRPQLSKSSLKVYNSVLNNLYRNITGKYNIPDPKWFMDEKENIMKYLSNAPRDSRKLRLSALVVLCENEPKVSEFYKHQMYKDIMDYNNEQKLQKKTEKQKENWITQSQVEEIYNKMRIDTRGLLKKGRSQKLSSAEHSQLQDFIMLSLFVLNPPRRSQDYLEFLLHKQPTLETNGIVGKKFVFNKYKTSKTYGEQKVDINPSLLSLLNQWKKINPNQEWLLIDKKGNKMTAPEMTRRLNKIFGKNISVSMLRHIYISDKILKNMPALNDLQETATDMANSVNQQILYKKV